MKIVNATQMMKTTWFILQKENQKQVHLKKLKRRHCVMRQEEDDEGAKEK